MHRLEVSKSIFLVCKQFRDIRSCSNSSRFTFDYCYQINIIIIIIIIIINILMKYMIIYINNVPSNPFLHFSTAFCICFLSNIFTSSPPCAFLLSSYSPLCCLLSLLYATPFRLPLLSALAKDLVFGTCCFPVTQSGTCLPP